LCRKKQPWRNTEEKSWLWSWERRTARWMSEIGVCQCYSLLYHVSIQFSYDESQRWAAPTPELAPLLERLLKSMKLELERSRSGATQKCLELEWEMVGGVHLWWELILVTILFCPDPVHTKYDVFSIPGKNFLSYGIWVSRAKQAGFVTSDDNWNSVRSITVSFG
jgi:hypothetical protein